MDRKTFLIHSMQLTTGFYFSKTGNLLRKPIDAPATFDSIQFLGADQSTDQIILFSGKPDANGNLKEAPIWQFGPDFRPTDAKRYDSGGETKVLVASHGAIYEVPLSKNKPIIWAPTYSSCHSVERLPDGNLISANSNDHHLTIHFAPLTETNGKIRLTDKIDFPFETAHGVVYDKAQDLVWALGKVIGKFKYQGGSKPQLKQLDTYALPACHTDGHDLFPLSNGNLLITTHEGVMELPMGNFASALKRSELQNVKSAVGDIKGKLYVTAPEDIPGYETWQTDTIIDLDSGSRIKRPGAKFYKIRLWMKNSFSY